MPFGQIVIGPGGSGKTTYCLGMKEFMESIGRYVESVGTCDDDRSLIDTSCAPQSVRCR